MNEDVFNPQITSNANLYKIPGQSKTDFLKQYGELVFKENSIKEDEPHKTIIIAFEGRFHDFNDDHKMVIEMLYTMFGQDNVYLLISEGSNTFTERKENIINSPEFIINPNNIIYKGHFNFNAKHILNTIGIINNIERFVLIVVASIEDDDMLPVEDKKTYYQPWPQELYTCDKKELYHLSNLLPSAKIHGFRMLIDSISSEYKSIEKKVNKLPYLLGLKNIRDMEINSVQLNKDVELKRNMLGEEFIGLLKNKSINS